MTKIEWVKNNDGSNGKTWNPFAGCSIVSPGCINCYAMKMAARIEACNAGLPSSHGGALHYAGTTKSVNGNPVWTGKIGIASDEVLLKPLRRKKPTTWFVNSMSDMFHESVPDEAIDRVFAVMALTPQHTYQVLTKRSARMREYFIGKDRYRDVHPLEDRIGEIADAAGRMMEDGDNARECVLNLDWPLLNVWLGVSTERQREADERIPDLLATPAAVRFISAEPLLGPIDLERIGTLDGIRKAMPNVIEREERGKPKAGAGSICGAQIDAIGSPGSSITFFQTPDHMGGFTAASPRRWPRLDWVIVGGESGPSARPMHPDWARGLRDQCASDGVPFFFKQWGSWYPTIDRDKDDPDWRRDYGCTNRQPNKYKILNLAGGCGFHGERVHLMQRYSKSSTGRLLDGVEHNAMPEAASR